MKIYVTFGQDHAHSVDGKTFDRNCVAMISADNYEEGRKKTFEYFGAKFCTTYTEEQITKELMSHFPRGVIKL